MTEQLVDRLNKHPINQIIQARMKQAKVKPDPDFLYLLQLPAWALRTGKVEVQDATNPHAQVDLLEVVEKLLLVDPQKVMELLLKQGAEPEGDRWVEPKIVARIKDPVKVAMYLLDRIQALLIEGEEPEPKGTDQYGAILD